MLPESVKSLEVGDEVIVNAQGNYILLSPTKIVIKDGTKAIVDGRMVLHVPSAKLTALTSVDHLVLKFGDILFCMTEKEMEQGFDLGSKHKENV